jgi:hypothetical protein
MLSAKFGSINIQPNHYRPYLNDNIGVLFTDSPFYLWMGMMEINFSITHILSLT